MRDRRFRWGLLITVVALIAAGCSSGVSETVGDRPSVFRMNLSTEPPTLDWSLATDGVSITVIENLMEGLTQFDDRLRPRPAVAMGWTVSEDGKTYTFHLRDDVSWTDGKPVTAYDFEYAWKRLLDPKTAAEYAYFLYDIQNAYEYNSGKIKNPDAVGVKAINPQTLEVHLKTPVVFFPSITAFTGTYPQRRDLIERYGDHWTDPSHLVTDGPFRLMEWRHEYKLTLSANPGYYAGRPRLDLVEMFVVNERTTALTLYETGDLDFVNLPPEAIPFYQKALDYMRGPLLRSYYYGFNVSKKPFDDARVRRAFSMAIDRAELPRVLKGREIPTSSWIPKGMLGYNPEIGLKFDPKGARRILAEAGYPNGRGLPNIRLVYNTDLVNTLIAQNIQAQWKRNLNVQVNLDNQEWKVFLKQLKTDPPQIFRLGWGADYPDPDNFMVLFTTDSGNNRTHWGNRRYDELIEKAATETHPERRRKMYDEAQRILTEQEVPIMPLFIAVQNLLLKPYVRGLRLNALELLYLKQVRLEPSGSYRAESSLIHDAD
jgi:oligopeptide transport system substrate-binding protein